MRENLTAEQPDTQLRFVERDPDVCRNRHGGNRESKAAHSDVLPSKADTRQQIMDYARHKKGVGVTADEVAAAFGCTHGHVSPRISELCRSGQLVRSTARRKTRAGSTARVLLVSSVNTENQKVR
mgnify:CR=1 FL=1